MDVELELMEAYHGGRHVLHVGQEQLALALPPGMEDGHRIRVKGHGDAGKSGGDKGDLLVTFRVKAHARFTRTGNDLHTTVVLSERIRAFGGDVLIPTPGDAVKISVEPGVHGRPQMRLAKRGFPVYDQRGEFGDLIVTFIAAD